MSLKVPTLTFRCASRSERDQFHTITVQNGTVLCSCFGTDWCSHIDATLLAGERDMVPFEEWDTVDQAQDALEGILKEPPNWKAHWREDKIWRGLTPPRRTAMEIALRAGKPTICFIGRGNLGTRIDYIEEATDLGWAIMENPSSLITLVVFNPRQLRTRKGLLALDMDLPRVTFDEWDHCAHDFTEAIVDAIDRYRQPPDPTHKKLAA